MVLEPIARADLMKAQADGETGGNGRVVVTFQSPTAAEEVMCDEARRLHDMEQTVTVL